MSLGPVDFIVVRFPGTKLSGEITAGLRSLIEAGTIRVIDLLFVVKDGNGVPLVEEIGELDEGDYQGWEPIVSEVSGFMTGDDALLIADALGPNTSAVLVLVENTWAVEMVKAIKNADGDVLVSERLPRAVVEELVAQHVE